MSVSETNMANKKIQVLILDDDEDILLWFRREFDQESRFQFHYFSSLRSATEILASQSLELDMVLSDLDLGEGDGFALLEQCRIHYPTLPFCIMTAHASVDNTMEALRMGVFDYLQKPLNKKDIEMLIEKCMRFSEVKRENLRLRESLSAQSRLKSTVIAESVAMKRVMEVVRRIAPSKASALILGESGVGKEVIAKQIHLNSSRSKEVFIPVNCAALPENLIESELFGHKKGAFTGADSASDGLIRAANKGTLFLDEIGELPLLLQSKLLRFLQEETVRPVGGTAEHPVDVRVITATNRDLLSLVKEGKFREDLYFRLNVVPLTIAPLRERPEDTRCFVPFFLKSYALKHNPRVKGISAEATRELLSYNWPGNVRELENTIERAIVLAQSSEVQVEDLMLRPVDLGRKIEEPVMAASEATNHLNPVEVSAETNGVRSSEPAPAPIAPRVEPVSDASLLPHSRSFSFHFQVKGDDPVSLAKIEEAYIRHLSENHPSSKEELADVLGINRKTLYRKQKEFGIE